MTSQNQSMQQENRQKQFQKSANLFTLIALGSSLFLLICYLLSPKSGMEAMIIMLPWLLVIAVHFFCSLLAIIFVFKTGKLLRNLGIIFYFLFFWGIHLQLFVSMNEIDVAIKAKIYEYTHPKQAKLYNTLKKYQYTYKGMSKVLPKDKEEIIALIQNKTDINYIHPGNTRTIFSLATATGDTDILAELLEAGADIEGDAVIWSKPLMIATQRKHAKTVTFLLEHGADPNSPDYVNSSPLMTAVKQEDPQTTAALLAGGADPNKTVQHSVSPLFFAATKANPQLTKLLLEAGADPNQIHFKKETPILRAAKAGCTECVCLMTEADGANSGATSKGESPLFLALESANSIMADCLTAQAQPTDVNQKDLLLAIKKQDLPLLKELLKRGVDPNVPNASGQFILSQLLVKNFAPQLSEDKRLEAVKTLLDNGAAIHQKDKKNSTPLNNATKAHFDKIAAYLLQHGDFAQHIKDINHTVLFEAVRNGNTQLATLYLENGADLNQCEQEGCLDRYLQAATRSNNPKMVALLLQHMPSILDPTQLRILLRQLANKPEALAAIADQYELNQFLDNKQTPLQVVWQSKNIKSVLIMLDAGAKPWLSSNKDEPFLDFVRKGHVDLVHKSLQLFTELQTDQRRMKNAMYWAVRNGHVDIVEEIIQYGVFFNRLEEVYALLEWTKPPKRFPQAKQQIRKIFESRIGPASDNTKTGSPLLQVIPAN